MIFKIKVWWFWFGRYRADYPTSEAWSDRLNSLIEQGCIFKNIDEFTADFGTYKLWIANCPYASFRKYNDVFNGGVDGFLPNKAVAYKLNKIIKKSIKIQNVKRIEDYNATI